MSEEIELAAKTVAESIEPLAEVSGVFGPIKELSDWISSFIHYRRMPAFAKQVNKAAEKIRREELPPAAVPDELLRKLLEGGSMEDDEDMAERWANLLANAVSDGAFKVHPAFPGILSQLQPADARTLDELATEAIDDGSRSLTMISNTLGMSRENLKRLGLVEVTTSTTEVDSAFAAGGATTTYIVITEFGLEFVLACREPTALD